MLILVHLLCLLLLLLFLILLALSQVFLPSSASLVFLLLSYFPFCSSVFSSPVSTFIRLFLWCCFCLSLFRFLVSSYVFFCFLGFLFLFSFSSAFCNFRSLLMSLFIYLLFVCVLLRFLQLICFFLSFFLFFFSLVFFCFFYLRIPFSFPCFLSVFLYSSSSSSSPSSSDFFSCFSSSAPVSWGAICGCGVLPCCSAVFYSFCIFLRKWNYVAETPKVVHYFWHFCIKTTFPKKNFSPVFGFFFAGVWLHKSVILRFTQQPAKRKWTRETLQK